LKVNRDFTDGLASFWFNFTAYRGASQSGAWMGIMAVFVPSPQSYTNQHKDLMRREAETRRQLRKAHIPMKFRLPPTFSPNLDKPLQPKNDSVAPNPPRGLRGDLFIPIPENWKYFGLGSCY
jgi:hypothetical protein